MDTLLYFTLLYYFSYCCEKTQHQNQVYWCMPFDTWEADTGRFLLVRGQPGVQKEFQARQGYIVQPCLKTSTKQTNKQILTKAISGRMGWHGSQFQAIAHHGRAITAQELEGIWSHCTHNYESKMEGCMLMLSSLYSFYTVQGF